jgi:hypothetical protein
MIKEASKGLTAKFKNGTQNRCFRTKYHWYSIEANADKTLASAAPIIPRYCTNNIFVNTLVIIAIMFARRFTLCLLLAISALAKI